MTRKIFQSIMLVAGAVLVLGLAIIMGCLYNYFGWIEEKQLESELSLAAAGVEENGKDYLEKLESDSFRLTWVSENGQVLYDTQADAESMENHAGREEIKEALENESGQSLRYSATLLEKTLYCAQRLTDGSVLRASVSYATVWALAKDMLGPVFAVLIWALLLSGLLAKRVSRRITEPLNWLDLEKPLETEAYEELAPLLERISSQHKQIDSQLRELQRRNDEFAQITGSMTEGLVLLNEKGAILSINPAAIRLFHADADCAGRDFLSVERSSDINRAIQNALSEGHSEIQISRDGREYLLNISRIESNGAAAGAVLLTFDITDRAFAEQNRREFTANVSHELKTPLQSIMGSAELIENGLVKPEDMPLFVGRIRTEAKRLVTLIDDIIRLSRLDEGGEMPLESVDLYEIANEVADTLKDAAEDKNIKITVDGKSVKINSVRRLVGEIVFNLCDNAVKYNVDGGTVDISVSPAGKGAVLTVKDSGIGIPQEHQSRVFERFYRVDKSHSKESGGTGLGLSIVKHAVQYLGGEIELQSEPGKGTEIQVVFI